ncbi:MAG: transposase [Candidatus Methanomethylicia archaeon]
MEFREVSDGKWDLIRLSPRARTGRSRVDDRRVLNGILYVLTTGCSWMYMPSKYGHYLTAFRRLKKWMEINVWKHILDTITSKFYW